MQMRQLLQNLLGNALKFRRDGVAPSIARARQRRRRHRRDRRSPTTASASTRSYAARIFRAFERLHGTSAYPGTGIGLALCRKIVERHRGTITADGRPDEGATFTVRSRSSSRRPSHASPAKPPSAQSEEGPHALA